MNERGRRAVGPLYTLDAHHEAIVCELLGVDKVELAEGQGAFAMAR
jgi:hypothetical protein